MTSQNYRDYIIPDDNERIRFGRSVRTPAEYSKPVLSTPEAIELMAHWRALYEAPYRGITANGTVEDGLYQIADEGFDVAAAVDAANALLAAFTEEQRKAASYPVDAPERRGWYNPELTINNNGQRMEHVSDAAKEAYLKLLATCTSKRGFTKVRQLMKANLFLGELYDLRHIMSEWTYHFLMFGTPSLTEPWGWSYYGHHDAYNVFILGRQMVVSPTFMGVEPNEITLQSGESFTLFKDEERRGLAFMQSLSPDQRARATLYRDMEDPLMPPDRFNFADQRHQGGAFQDNRIVPYEGVCAAEFTPAQRAALLGVIETFLEHLPDGPRAARMKHIAQHLDRTWWSWIGGHGDDDPFYFHIHSPVVMIEFDHHSGMLLTNKHPAKFHIHIITRIPNGNDYGNALLRLHRQKQSAA